MTDNIDDFIMKHEIENIGKAQELLDSREEVYGDRVTNMERVAQVFSGILGTEVRADQVPLLMVGYKTVRASQTPDYEDNVKDIEGYAIMFREVIGEAMISAVNTDEYLQEKSRREVVEMEGPSEPAEYCRGCGRTLAVDAPLKDHAKDCQIAERNRHVRAYNWQGEEDVPAFTREQVKQLRQEVPSYQPGPVQGQGESHLYAYRQQLEAIFMRTWREVSPTTPTPKFAEAAAREAVGYFWLTFQKNEELQKRVSDLGWANERER